MNQQPIEGLLFLETKTFADHRGYFRETYHQARLERELGRRVEFVQDNESLSLKPGVVRGLHFQRAPHTQAKLVRVPHGAIFDVAVDLRPGSPTYGQWRGFTLTSESGAGLFVPEGFAHGFCALADDTVVTYKVSDFYAPECEGGVKWNDPELAVAWPLPAGGPIMTDKDAALPLLSELGPLTW